MLKIKKSYENDLTVYSIKVKDMDISYESILNCVSKRKALVGSLSKVSVYSDMLPVYLLFVWELIKNSNVYLVPTYYSYTVLSKLNLPHKEVDWEYNMIDSNGAYLDGGYIKANSIIEENKAYRIIEKTNLIKATKLIELIDIVCEDISNFDTHHELNIYSLKDNSIEKLIEILKANKKPTLDNLLNNNDIFINLIIGIDIGYNDSITIKTKANLNKTLKSISSKFNCL